MKTPKILAKPHPKITNESLRHWNAWLAVIHAAQGVIILVLSAGKLYPVTTSYLGVDTLQTQAQGHTVLAAGMHHLFDVNLAYVIAAFFFMAAIAHGLVATKLRGQYERDLKQKVNKARWIEYVFSASTIVVAVSLLVGVQDISTLFALFGLTAVASLLGLVMEVHNQDVRKVSWLSYVVSCIAGILPWLVVAAYLIGDGMYGQAVPAFVDWIFATTLILFCGFAVNMYLQYRKAGAQADYSYSERRYMVLSLVVKTALAWQIFAGVLHP